MKNSLEFKKKNLNENVSLTIHFYSYSWLILCHIKPLGYLMTKLVFFERNYMASSNYSYSIIFICKLLQILVIILNIDNLHTVIWFQVFLSNVNNSFFVIICKQISSINYPYLILIIYFIIYVVQKQKHHYKQNYLNYVQEIWGVCSHLFIAITPRSTLTWRESTY